MQFKSPPVRVLLPIALMALLAVLATLQYRWLGQVSEAERDRMRATVSARASSLAEDFDREITRLFLLFQVGTSQGDAATALAGRLGVWRTTAKYPRMLAAVYVATSLAASGELQKLNPDSKSLEPAAWTGALAKVRQQLAPASSHGPMGTFVVRIAPTVVDDPLVVAVPLARTERRTAGSVIDTRLITAGTGYVLLVLDDTYVRTELLPLLVRQYLLDNTSDYHVAIVSARNPGTAIYASDATPVTRDGADVVSTMLSLRFGLADRIVGPELRALATTVGAPVAPAHEGGSTAPERVTVFFEQRSATVEGTQSAALKLSAAMGSGGWQLLLKHRAGSLEAAVAKVRRRNLFMSFGMLALLAASMGLVVVSARRAERLAAQQMDFVATVSHELRTPLAVIRSAGQNLADGVVHEPGQTRQYGELIESEGRRLTDMIEQTLALAGLSGDRRPLAPQPLDAGSIVRDVIGSPDVAAATAPLDVAATVQDDVPVVLADAMLLRRAVQNLVVNAAKYGGDGGWVGVAVEAHGAGRAREVRITVSDRGPGIDSRDLPHLFEPFFRGRDAVARQVQGNGLGLHLVKRIAEAHGGRVSVRSSAGHGAAFTVHLPVHARALEALSDVAPQHS